MNSHEQYAALLDAFLDGELSEAEAGEVRAHLSECADCQAYVADALAIRDAFPDVEETAVPDGFAESVLAALPPRRVSWRAHWTKIALPLAACAALAILLHGVADIGTGGGASMSSYTEEAVTSDMDAGGGSPMLGSTAVADDADTVPPQAPEAALQSVQNTTTEETEPDMMPFAMRSSGEEVPEESEAESASNSSAAPAAAKGIEGYVATEAFPDEANVTEEIPDGTPTTKELPDEAPATKELPGKDAATEKVPDEETKTEAIPDGDTKAESVDVKEPFPDEVPPKPEPDVNEVTLFGESGTKEETEFPEKYETTDFASGAVSMWTLPAEALDLFDDYDPAEKTESGIWYALTPEDFDALSQKLAKMELEIVSGADAPPSTARPGMEYVFVPM
ncbi:MAG: zf-HC2 domain-containing protein [Oscillibacter sp.]|nr:zf-HC2 domain-containing protein [Oscillibacter sp.]